MKYVNKIGRALTSAFIISAITIGSAQAGTTLKIGSKVGKGPDFVPVSIQTNNQCKLKLVFKNQGSGPQKANQITMDHKFQMVGDFYVNNVHYKNKVANYGDLVIPIMLPGATKVFTASFIRIAGPTRVTWTVNSHAGGGIPEITKANNIMKRSIKCVGGLQG
ncbi:MAG: hypothetical protein ACI8P9_000708 [Parasphingorhabdus sp.]|jgi:hypothetical protein